MIRTINWPYPRKMRQKIAESALSTSSPTQMRASVYPQQRPPAMIIRSMSRFNRFCYVLVVSSLFAATTTAYVVPSTPFQSIAPHRRLNTELERRSYREQQHGRPGWIARHHHSTVRMAEEGDVDSLSSVVSGGSSDVSFNLMDSLLHNPVFWSVSIMVTIVALLYTWEETVDNARERSPPSVQVVIDRILAEMGGLGFIGLVLSVGLNKFALGSVVEEASERFLGNDEILLEAFESLHETFFQAGILFFATCAIMLVRVISTVERISSITEQSIRENQQSKVSNESTSDSDKVPMEAIEAMLKVKELKDGNKDISPWRRELSLTIQERGAEALVIRERLVREMDLGDEFRIEKYLERMFATNKLDLVAISPLSWLPLIPALAAANGVDLEHNVVSVESINAAESSGYFLATPWVFLPTCAIQTLKFVWGAMNFWKMATVKDMLVPELVQLQEDVDGKTTAVTRICPPQVESAQARQAFDSTPVWVKPVEALFRTKEPVNRVQELFGTVGGSGLAFYLNSIKFHTWLCVTSIVVYASQIIPRDIYALQHADSVQVGLPQLLLPEIAVYGTFALLNIGELLMAPTTFLNYCLITCVEDMVQTESEQAGGAREACEAAKSS